MSLFGWIEQKILDLLAPILGPLKPLITIFTKLRDNTIGILDAGTNLISSTERTYDKIKHFTVQPSFKHRVISVPRVQENIAELAQVPTNIIDAFKDLFNQLKNKIDPAAFEVEELEGLEDLRAIITKFGSKIAAGFEKVLGIVTLVVDALVTIRQTITDLQTIVSEVETTIDELSNLEGLFLPQNNPRRSERLAEGGSIKIRVGSLHS